MTLLMLKIESEQEEYRKLMRLAEELCIEDFATVGDAGDNNERDVEMKEAALEKVFERESCLLEGVDSDEILQLKALCHVSIKTDLLN